MQPECKGYYLIYKVIKEKTSAPFQPQPGHTTNYNLVSDLYCSRLLPENGKFIIFRICRLGQKRPGNLSIMDVSVLFRG